MASEYEVKDFETEVIDASQEIPVMVDFWAPWCGPCLMLEPIIVEIAEQNPDKVRLVKVNTDVNPDLANRYNIRGIPAIRIFHNGDIVAEFNGLMYKRDFERWLMESLPDENRTRLIEIKRMIDAGQTEGVKTSLEQLLKKAPHILEVRVLLASYYILHDSRKAVDLVSEVQQNSPFFPVADAIRVIHELNILHDDGQALGGGPDKDDLLAAVEFIRNKELEAAMESLMSIIDRNKNYHKGIAPRAMIALFSILGNTHPLTVDYRKRFDMALY